MQKGKKLTLSEKTSPFRAKKGSKWGLTIHPRTKKKEEAQKEESQNHHATLKKRKDTMRHSSNRSLKKDNALRFVEKKGQRKKEQRVQKEDIYFCSRGQKGEGRL